MAKNAKDSFTDDLENRLNDFFDDPDPTPNASEPLDEDSILKDLKSSVLAIDWEITDDALDDFISQVRNLEKPFEKDKINQKFFKMLIALAKYLRRHKSNAHPDTLKCMMAVYSALEKAVTETELNQDEKKKLLVEQIKRFNKLKMMISHSKAKRSKADNAGPSADKLPDIDKVIAAISDLKSVLLKEFAAIRMEIEQLQK